MLADVVTSPEVREHYRSAGLWTGERLVDKVDENASAQQDAVAVVDQGGTRRRTFGELQSDAARLATYLRSKGVTEGDVVSVQLPNNYEFVVSLLGVLATGAVLNPLLPSYGRKETQHILARAAAKAIVIPAAYRGVDHGSRIQEMQSELPELEFAIAVGSDRTQDGVGKFEDAVSTSDGDGVGLGDYSPAPSSAVSEVIFTSGTEASPKAIMHTEDTTNFSARTAWSSLGITGTDVVWMPSPLGHSTGLNYGARFALYHGLKLVLQDRWDPESAGALIEDEACSYTLAATTFLHDLVATSDRESWNLSTMRFFGCGGAPVPSDLVAAAEEKGINVLRLYGSTEALVATWNRLSTPLVKRRETDGCPVEHVEVQTRHDNGDENRPGEPGEIYVRGPNTCVGFLDDPERLSETFAEDGWLRSGDLGILDTDGYLSVIGRKKEIVIRGGMNIAPREIEDAIGEMESIDTVAVVGVPDNRLGERLCAFVVPRGTKTVELQDVVRHLEDRGLARFKLPEDLRVVDGLPRTASGKVQKFKLLEMAQEDKT